MWAEWVVCDNGGMSRKQTNGLEKHKSSQAVMKILGRPHREEDMTVMATLLEETGADFVQKVQLLIENFRKPIKKTVPGNTYQDNETADLWKQAMEEVDEIMKKPRMAAHCLALLEVPSYEQYKNARNLAIKDDVFPKQAFPQLVFEAITNNRKAWVRFYLENEPRHLIENSNSGLLGVLDAISGKGTKLDIEYPLIGKCGGWMNDKEREVLLKTCLELIEEFQNQSDEPLPFEYVGMSSTLLMLYPTEQMISIVCHKEEMLRPVMDQFSDRIETAYIKKILLDHASFVSRESEDSPDRSVPKI